MLVKVGPYVGLRPYEWLHATIVGHNLNVVNAKSGNGRALGEVRAIGLGWLPPKDSHVGEPFDRSSSTAVC